MSKSILRIETLRPGGALEHCAAAILTPKHVPEPTLVGRYAIYDPIASGGMAVVHFGRFLGPVGFSRTVAIKRMHPHLAREPEFVAMFLDEARLAARIRHPNVVSTLDVMASSGELLIVMEYVHGESLGKLLRTLMERKARMPVPVACAIAADLLSGLHAAHEAHDERGEPLRIVHRDVSPQNVLVGADGVARVLDFGVAKAVGRMQQTLEGQVKGKIAYMAPEQIRGQHITRATDVFAASIVLWEMLTSRRLFRSDLEADTVDKILFGTIDAPSACASNVPEALNAVVLRGLARDPSERYATARDMVRALRECVRFASASEVGDWIESSAGAELAERGAALAAIDRGQSVDDTLRMRASAMRQKVLVRREEQAAVVLPTDAIGTEATVLGAPPAAPARARRHRRAVWAGIPIAALIVLGIVAGRSSRGDRADASGAAASAPAPSAAPAPAPAPSSIPASELSDDTPTAAPSSTASGVSPSPAPTRPFAAPATRTRAPRPATPSRRHAPPGCDPPYTTDPDGTRRYKLECL